MVDYFITVLSYSLQISGALILFNWCSSNIDRRVKNRYLQPHKGLILVGPDEDMKIQLKKEELQKNATEVFKSCAAAFDIVLGYILAIFIKSTGNKRGYIIIQVLICVSIILVIEHFATKIAAKKKYPNDQFICSSEMTMGIAAFRRVD